MSSSILWTIKISRIINKYSFLLKCYFMVTYEMFSCLSLSEISLWHSTISTEKIKTLFLNFAALRLFTRKRLCFHLTQDISKFNFIFAMIALHRSYHQSGVLYYGSTGNLAIYYGSRFVFIFFDSDFDHTSSKMPESSRLLRGDRYLASENKFYFKVFQTGNWKWWFLLEKSTALLVQPVFLYTQKQILSPITTKLLCSNTFL